MGMFVRFLFITCIVLLVTGCPRSSEVHKPVTYTPKRHQQTRPLSDFSSVSVNGNLNVSLHTGYRHPHVILRGDPRDLAVVVTKMVNGKLYVAIGSGYPRYGSVQVEIDSRYLNSFEYRGAGVISGPRLRTSMLDVYIDNPGQTTLNGQIGLRKLIVKNSGTVEISGIYTPYLMVSLSGKPTVKLSGNVNLTSLDMNNDAKLSLYWVKSRELIIRGRKKAFIQLAGIVDKLNVELWGESRFNGRYLRAQRAFVKTHNKSVAEISAVKRQHTLATDTSDIHFYNIPEMKADFMAYDGAVLDMRNLASPFVQEYNEYNK